MPRRDPITGCMVLTIWEVLDREAQAEGKGRTAGDLFSDMVEEMGKEEEERARQLSDPTEAMRVINDGIKWCNEGMDPKEEGFIPYTVEEVLKVSDAGASFGFRQSSESLYALTRCSDGQERTIHFGTWQDNGDRMTPPEGETTVAEVLPAKMETPHNCPKCGKEAYAYTYRNRRPVTGKTYTCDNCFIEWPRPQEAT